MMNLELITLQVFYGCINLGSLSGLATPYMERDTDFWSAYLLCLCMFFVGTLVLVLGRKVYIVRPPQGSIITDAFRAMWMMVKARKMDAAKPSYQAGLGKSSSLRWDDHFVDELKRALVACQVCQYLYFFLVCRGFLVIWMVFAFCGRPIIFNHISNSRHAQNFKLTHKRSSASTQFIG